METFSALFAHCARNSPVTGKFPSQRPVTRSFDVFLDLRLNERLSKQSRGWWFETPSRPLWRHSNVPHLSVINQKRAVFIATYLLDITFIFRMMSSWHGSRPRASCLLSSRHSWILLTKGQLCRAFLLTLMLGRTSCRTNSRMPAVWDTIYLMWRTFNCYAAVVVPIKYECNWELRMKMLACWGQVTHICTS